MKLTSLGANRTVLDFEGGPRVFFSYSTPVAAFIPGTGFVRTATIYSRTTTGHINAWLKSEGGLGAPVMPQWELDLIFRVGGEP